MGVEHHHAYRVSILPGIHREPFDRILIAQAQTEQLLPIAVDQQPKDYDVETIFIEK